MGKSKTNRRKSSSRRLGGKRTLFVCIAAIAFIGIYAFFLLSYIVSPFTTRWRALYGEIAYPEGYSIHGIDVSHHQGKINWEKVANAEINKEPIAFVFIKATEGRSHLDENFNDNFYNARRQGLVRGAYHFFSPNVSGLEQAEYYLHQVHLDEGDMPPVLDIEEAGKKSADEIRREALAWLKRVEEQYAVPPIIYTGLNFKKKYLSTDEFKRYPFWIAHYYVQEVGYSDNWRFWQHTDMGLIDGIKGPVDLDIYNGSMYDLRHFLLGSDDTEDLDNEKTAKTPDD